MSRLAIATSMLVLVTMIVLAVNAVGGDALWPIAVFLILAAGLGVLLVVAFIDRLIGDRRGRSRSERWSDD
jgi:hypothetical protein